jgi:phosphoribosylanthranilate isomerase
MALLDASVSGLYGGTGKVFDWNRAIAAKAYAPVMLAGGLDLQNVAEAIAQVQPAAIDVCSGVEAAPGRKDLHKVRELLQIVRGINESFEVNSRE